MSDIVGLLVFIFFHFLFDKVCLWGRIRCLGGPTVSYFMSLLKYPSLLNKMNSEKYCVIEQNVQSA